jgi:hypothetical protein
MYYPADPETGSVEEYELVNWEAAGQEDREEFMYMCKEDYE